MSRDRFPLLRLLGVIAVLLVLPSAAPGALRSSSRLLVTRVGEGRVVSADGRLVCGGKCAAAYPSGTIVTLHASDTHYFAFVAWRGGCLGVSRTCLLQAGSVSRVRAVFRRKTFALRLTVGGPGAVRSTPSGIRCGQGAPSETCQADFGRGTTVILTARPSGTSVFGGWHGPCADSRTQCAVPMSDNRSATAGFGTLAPSSPGVITVKTVGVARRVVSVPGGIDCRHGCRGTFPAGTPVVLHTNPPVGVTGAFGGWSGACHGDVPTCPLVAGGPMLVLTEAFEAPFAPPFTGPPSFGVNVSLSGHGVVVGGGQINCGLRLGTIRGCQGYFDTGSKIVLRALPARGSRFTGWSGFCSGIGACRLTVDATKLVYAVFGH